MKENENSSDRGETQMEIHRVSLAEKAQNLLNQLVDWRRKIHMNPELSFQEFATAQFVLNILDDIPGMEVQTGIGFPTAVVGTLSSGSGPTVALRADMDALPITEDTEHDFKSENDGVMHACGHDAHTAILLGAAHLLADCFKNGEVSGTVKFIFQPAEESMDEFSLSGAPYMIQGGVLEDTDCVIALHVSPEIQVGEFQVNNGSSMANVDVFEATIYGSGGHGAYPHLGTDPTFMLGPVLQALYGIVSRKISPLEPAVVSIGQIHAGSASNIIPSEVFIQGTLRSYDREVRESLAGQLEQVFSIVPALGGEYQFSIQNGEPALYNDPTINEWMIGSIKALYPDARFIEKPFGLGGEDFAYMTNEIPGAMIFLGAAFADDIQRELHTPIFDIDERCLPIGAAVLAETARRILAGEVQLAK